MDTLTGISARMRKAVSSQAYDEARTLVPRYCSLLEREFRRTAPSSPEARRVAEEARDLYQWMARTLLLDRAHCAAELQRLASMASYQEPGGRTPHTCQLDA